MTYDTLLHKPAVHAGTIDSPMLKIHPAECEQLVEYIRDISGMDIPSSKTYLFETRLGKMVGDLGLSSYQALHDLARTDKTHSLAQQIIDAITTNETLFFRDEKVFDLIRYKLVPDVIDNRAGYARKGCPFPSASGAPPAPPVRKFTAWPWSLKTCSQAWPLIASTCWEPTSLQKPWQKPVPVISAVLN